ncbi:hypothetical protein KXW65_002684 [Aspergillus fumigatus]|nr:hypothetical protein KXW65_002684 [Aspergillus fumigatus]KAH3102494.1 hypothetical protein KXX00_005470 [Aspergillus fumigatus]
MSFGTLHIRDSRTNAEYEIPIRRNAVVAMDFKRIKAPAAGADRADQVDSGLRVHDPGLQNTTVVETEISFSDHWKRLLLYRGYTLEQLWDSDFEDMLHLRQVVQAVSYLYRGSQGGQVPAKDMKMDCRRPDIQT